MQVMKNDMIYSTVLLFLPRRTAAGLLYMLPSIGLLDSSNAPRSAGSTHPKSQTHFFSNPGVLKVAWFNLKKTKWAMTLFC
jgi:hypothetical protein